MICWPEALSRSEAQSDATSCLYSWWPAGCHLCWRTCWGWHQCGSRSFSPAHQSPDSRSGSDTVREEGLDGCVENIILLAILLTVPVYNVLTCAEVISWVPYNRSRRWRGCHCWWGATRWGQPACCGRTAPVLPLSCCASGRPLGSPIFAPAMFTYKAYNEICSVWS